jgi:endonuclease-3
MTKKERYKKAIEWFQVNMPVVQSELDYRTPFELLVAVILSAQCTDKRVNMVTPALFEKYPDAQTMSGGSPEDIYPFIASVSFPNNKAKHLYNMACMLVNDFEGIIPDDVDLLQQLPGVGRKTANVVATVVFDKSAMPVDTHVFRVSNRIGFTNNSKTPLETELELVKNIPPELLGKAHHWILLHGRYVCTARKPKCESCGLTEICRYYQQHKRKKIKNEIPASKS